MAKTIKVKQTSSLIRNNKKLGLTLKGLGLGKIGKSKELEDTLAVRGMVNKVSHLVKILEK